MAFMFEKLIVYQRAVDFADRVMTATKNFPRDAGFVRDQLIRAALYISLNTAEGNGRHHKNDRRHFFIIPRGSLRECVPLLELDNRQSLMKSNWVTTQRNELEEMSRMLSGLIRGVENRSN